MVGISIEAYDLPVSVEAAVWRADYAVKHDKTDPIQILACGDGYPSVSFLKPDGSITSLTFIDGAWHEQRQVK